MAMIPIAPAMIPIPCHLPFISHDYTRQDVKMVLWL
nr:MAG TPA: hypothetical protein [Caudoviricetes sp.]